MLFVGQNFSHNLQFEQIDLFMDGYKNPNHDLDIFIAFLGQIDSHNLHPLHLSKFILVYPQYFRILKHKIYDLH